MFSRPHKPFVTEKERREELRSSLRFLGGLSGLFLAAAGYFVWQDGGFSGTFYVMLIFAGFWFVPFGLVLHEFIQLRRKDRKDDDTA